MTKGSTCTFKLKAICGAPAFGAFPAPEALVSNASQFNITSTEFEFNQPSEFEEQALLTQILSGLDLDQSKLETDMIKTKLVYHKHTEEVM